METRKKGLNLSCVTCDEFVAFGEVENILIATPLQCGVVVIV